MDETIAHVRTFIYDQVTQPPNSSRNSTAAVSVKLFRRALTWLQERTGVDVENLAVGIGAVLSLYLLYGERNQLAANVILTIVPLLLTYVYVKERPATPHLLVYWGCYALLTLMDSILEDNLFGYYMIKVLLLACLFLKPIQGSAKILDALNSEEEVPVDQSHSAYSHDEAKAMERAKGKRSPPPEKPDYSNVSKMPPSTSESESGSTATSGSISILRTNRKFVPDSPGTSSGSVRDQNQNIVAIGAAVSPKESVSKRAEVGSSRLKESGAPDPQAVVKKLDLGSARLKKDSDSKRDAAKPPMPESETKKIDLGSSRQRKENDSKRDAQKPPMPSVEANKDRESNREAPSKRRGKSQRDTASNRATKIPSLREKPASLRSRTSSVPAMDSRYALSTTTSSLSTDSAPVNPHDLMFEPDKQIVFNAPFGDRAITYHMRVINTSHHPIGFAIKSNAIPRVTADPPHGIIKPNEKFTVAVTIQPFNYDEVNTSRDRIAYDYVSVEPAVKKFFHGLFQGQTVRRRKNIFIQYNP